MSSAARSSLGLKGVRPLLSAVGALAHVAFLVVYVTSLWWNPQFIFLVAAIILGLLVPVLPYHRSRAGMLAVALYPIITVCLLVALVASLL